MTARPKKLAGAAKSRALSLVGLENPLANESALTAKQRLFVEHYMSCLNGVEAARLAGYQGNYYALAAVASENLKKPNIAACIQNRFTAVAMGPHEIIARTAAIARGNLAPFLQTGGDGHVSVSLDGDAARANAHLLKKIKTKRSMVITGASGEGDGSDDSAIETLDVEFELHDPLKALGMLAQWSGLGKVDAGAGLGGASVTVNGNVTVGASVGNGAVTAAAVLAELMGIPLSALPEVPGRPALEENIAGEVHTDEPGRNSSKSD